MGWIRVLLAMAVVATHASMSFSVGGKLAVQLFYMISGFLMSYILVERRSYARIRDFYASRYLRLYPVYVVVALATLLAYVIARRDWFDKFEHLPSSALVLLTVSNAFIFFQDAVMFTAVQGGQLVPTTDFMRSDVALFTGLIVPQAWTLSLELMFYLLAPFVLPFRRLLISLFIASILLRVYLIYIGIGSNDPWSYRFFPTELALFILGALSHQVLLTKARKIASPMIVRTVFATTVAVLLFWSLLPAPGGFAEIALFAAFACSLPFQFLFQNASTLDQKVGDLSYPLYINHTLTLNVCEFFFAKVGLIGSLVATSCFFVVPMIVAFVLVKAVAEPVERWRCRLRIY